MSLTLFIKRRILSPLLFVISSMAFIADARAICPTLVADALLAGDTICCTAAEYDAAVMLINSCGGAGGGGAVVAGAGTATEVCVGVGSFTCTAGAAAICGTVAAGVTIGVVAGGEIADEVLDENNVDEQTWYDQCGRWMEENVWSPASWFCAA